MQKDVVDGDKKDIVKEYEIQSRHPHLYLPLCPRFFAKFSQIVSKEQATNFITVLHNSQLTVIPWSVIQSREFYALFGKLRNLLFSQKSTHGTAGQFLITLKTLMAKMKVIALTDFVILSSYHFVGTRLGVAGSCVFSVTVSTQLSLTTTNRNGH